MLRLVVDCEDQIRYFPIAGEAPLSLGASEDNDICVPFPGVSRRHAELRLVGGGVVVADVGSKNGIVDLEGGRHAQLLLAPGGSVRIGRAVVALEEVSTSDVELALAVDAGGWSARTSVRSADTEDEQASRHQVGSPKDALRFVREVDRLEAGVFAARSARFLEKARGAVGARSLVVARLARDGGLAVVAHAGRAVEGSLLEALEERLSVTVPAAEHGAMAALPGPPPLIWMRRGSHSLAAVFDDQPSPWRLDFLEYLAGRFCGDGVEGSDAAPLDDRPEDPTLQVPRGMVLGTSPAMVGLLTHLRITVQSDLDVLLVGETGTGKELFARMIHQSGPTASGPFVAVNCAAIPHELLEAELFGVLAGAATGVDARPGLFVKANGGAIFLDEITEMADPLHAKLLRVVQEREVLPVGGSTARKIKVRVISACNRDLATLVRERKFRADLYYRLRGLQFHIPPLRERPEDIPDLLLSFVGRAARKYDKRIAGVSRKALRILLDHDWPGNIRELETEVERAVLLCPHGATLESDHFASVKWELGRRNAEAVAATTSEASAAAADVVEPAERAGELQGKLDAVEREAILAALAKSGGNKTKAATMLGVTRNGLRLKMIRLGIHWQ